MLLEGKCQGPGDGGFHLESRLCLIDMGKREEKWKRRPFLVLLMFFFFFFFLGGGLQINITAFGGLFLDAVLGFFSWVGLAWVL